jgi:hypothetical protein
VWAVSVLLVAAVAVGLAWFTPWKIFTSTTVRETLSTPAPVPTATSTGTAGPVLLAQAPFVAHEHPTTGTARIVQATDGSRQLELVGLDTSDGPDLRVWLTDQGLRPARHVELGRLKGNRGDQVYPIPAGTDLSGLHSVTIWCIRFSVSFGAAELGAL